MGYFLSNYVFWGGTHKGVGVFIGFSDLIDPDSFFDGAALFSFSWQ